MNVVQGLDCVLETRAGRKKVDMVMRCGNLNSPDNFVWGKQKGVDMIAKLTFTDGVDTRCEVFAGDDAVQQAIAFAEENVLSCDLDCQITESDDDGETWTDVVVDHW